MNGVSDYKQRLDICRTKPPENWVKVNVDGAQMVRTSTTTAACVIGDDLGRWRIRATQNVGICCVAQAEMRGALMGLKLAWAEGFLKVILETNSKVVEAI